MLQIFKEIFMKTSEVDGKFMGVKLQGIGSPFQGNSFHRHPELPHKVKRKC